VNPGGGCRWWCCAGRTWPKKSWLGTANDPASGHSRPMVGRLPGIGPSSFMCPCDRGASHGEELSIIIPARNEETNLPRCSTRSPLNPSALSKSLLWTMPPLMARPRLPAKTERGSSRRSRCRRVGGQNLGVSSGRAGRRGAKIVVPRCRHVVRAGGAGARPRGISRRRRWRSLRRPFHVVRDFHEQFSAFFNLVMLAAPELLPCSATGIRSVVARPVSAD